MRAVKVLIISSILLFSACLNAAETKAVLQFGYEFGGEALVETSESDLNAGGGLNIAGGVSIEPENSAMAYVATFGYTFDDIDFDIPSGSSSFDTTTLEFTARRKFGPNHVHELGGGLTYQLNPSWEFCLSGVGCDTIDFDAALGFNILYSYNARQLFLTGKYTFIDYEVAGVSIDANSFGLLLGWKFR